MAQNTGISSKAIWSTVALVVIHTSINIVYKSSQIGGLYTFSPAGSLVASELCKFLLSLVLLLRFSSKEEQDALWGLISMKSSASSKPSLLPTSGSTNQANPESIGSTLLKVLVLAGLYAINNNLAFYLFSLSDPATITLFKSISAFSTALALYFALGRPITKIQWFAVMFQCSGLVVFQYNPCKGVPLYDSTTYLLLLLAVCITTVTSVWNDFLLKSTNLSLNCVNLFLYGFGVIYNCGFFLQERWKGGPGLFEGYTAQACLVVFLNSIIGIAISLVYKYGDALVKTFASAITAVNLLIASSILFGMQTHLLTWVGALVTVLATYMYVSVPSTNVPNDTSKGETNKGADHSLSKPTKTPSSRISSYVFATIAGYCFLSLGLFYGLTFAPKNPAVHFVDNSDNYITDQNPSVYNWPVCAVIKMKSQPSAERVAPIKLAFDLNEILYTIVEDETVPPYHWAIEFKNGSTSNCDGDTIAKYALDNVDSCEDVNTKLFNWSDKYFKTSWNAEFIKFSSKGIQAVEKNLLSTASYKRLMELQNSGKMFSIPYASGYYAEGEPVPLIEKKAIFSTLSHHVVTTTGNARMELYNLINASFPADERIQMHIIDSRGSIKKTKGEWYENTIFSSPILEGKNPYNSVAFREFVQNSWFWLNLGGIGFSQPNRLEVACRFRAAVVSDVIYAEWAQDFPAYYLSVDTELHKMDTDLVRREMKLLVENYKEIYGDLWPKQEEWCHTRFWPRNWLHYMLRELPNQPLKHVLRKDTAAMKFYYP
ncbi:hypothetical protein MP638_005193 [Amoeboaphelidium occidentale]|nr:hypothetical protein MP638_005193 [Amoeboaphelidium occidentale]